MFWIIVAIVALALVLFQLGAYSVWFVVLKVALVVAAAVIAGLALMLAWRRLFG